MRILLLWFFLGLAVINASPIDSMTQMPVRPEEDVLEEVITDGFLVDHFFGTSVTTEPPTINTTIQEPQQTPSEVFTEGISLLENHLASKTESPEAPTTIQMSSQPISDSSEGSGFLMIPILPTIQTPELTTIPASPQTTFDISDEGSGDSNNYISSSSYFDLGQRRGNFFQPSSSTTTKTLTASTTTIPTTTKQQKPQMPKGRRLSPVENDKPISVGTEVNDPKKEPGMQKGHITPDWIIIVGFIVGLAALVTLCAAIATRDKWNAKQTFVNETNATDQKREMQKFIPKEDGKETEYTIIPLDNLSDHQSH